MLLYVSFIGLENRVGFVRILFLLCSFRVGGRRGESGEGGEWRLYGVWFRN